MALLRGDAGRVLCVGHRGAPLLEAENTIASFRAAVGCGVDLVELDVSVLADGTLVVTHSLDLAELSHGRATGHAGSAGLGELRRLAPDLPTLDDALDFFAEEATGVGVHLDLKVHGAAVARVATGVARRGLVERTVVTSTSVAALRVSRREVPALATGITYPLDRHGVSRHAALAPIAAAGLHAVRVAAPVRVPRLARAAGAHAAFVHHAVVTGPLVRRLRRGHLAVLAWTVDDPGDVVRVVSAGIDGVISNDPAMVLATLSA